MSEFYDFDNYKEDKIFQQNQTPGLDVIDVICENTTIKESENRNFFMQIFIDTKEFLTGQHNTNEENDLNKTLEKNVLKNGFEQEIKAHKELMNIVEKLSLNPNYLQDTLNITNNNQLKYIIDKLVENPNYLNEITAFEN